jgi:hypothetical protein
MISIKYNSPKPLLKEIDRHKSLVIIGEAKSDHLLNEIAYYENEEVVLQLYGESQLSKAFSIAKKIGVKHIFMVNAKRNTDYGYIANNLKQYDFTYIVPLGVNFSDTFFNASLNRPMYYSELFLETVGKNTSSVVLMKEKHASLYENIDHYLGDMESKILLFKNIAHKALKNGRSMCLVGNNLVDYTESNLVLGSLLCISEIGDYPYFDFGQAVFDIDDFDISSELIYFKNNYLTNTSVENLKNFRFEEDAGKIMQIDRVIRYIERELDFSSFVGKSFTPHVQLAVYRKLGDFLQSIMNSVIRDYHINSVEFVKTSIGTGSLLNSFTILPINSIEEFDVMMEV